MSKNEMTCPHCNEEPAIFEATKPIKIVPTIENWTFDEPMNQIATDMNVVYICLNCGSNVRINPTRREITPLGSIPEPTWSEAMDKLLEDLRKAGDKAISSKDWEVARRHNFFFGDLVPCKEAIRKIMLSKP
jgi:DNA-directed RNA polymerase subunit RPC12/RpoP